MLKNLIPLRLAEQWALSAEETSTALEARRHKPCGATEVISIGWLPPVGGDDRYALPVGRHLLLRLHVETKTVPGGLVRKMAATRAAKIEREEGRKVGRKEMRDLRERITEELLPKVLPKDRSTLVWIDTKERWLGIDASSMARASEVIEMLAHSLETMPKMAFVRTQMAPASAMADWLTKQEAPAGFTLDDCCELTLPVEKSTVRYTRHNLEIAEIRAHIANGKLPVKLAMTHDDRMSFVLAADLTLKKIGALDILMEEAEQQAESAQEQFEASFAIVAGQLALVLSDLIKALDGEMEESGG